MIKCNKCGGEMFFKSVHETEAIEEENFLLVEERWECLECDTMELIEFIGTIKSVKRIEIN